MTSSASPISSRTAKCQLRSARSGIGPCCKSGVKMRRLSSRVGSHCIASAQVLLFGGQVVLGKGPKSGITRKSRNSLVNADRADLACVVGPQISKHPIRKGISCKEQRDTGANALHSACTR